MKTGIKRLFARFHAAGALLLCVFAPLGESSAQSTGVIGNANYTNCLVAAATPTKLYAVTGYNSGPAQFIQVFSGGATTNYNQVVINDVLGSGTLPLNVAGTYTYSSTNTFYNYALYTNNLGTAASTNIVIDYAGRWTLISSNFMGTAYGEYMEGTPFMYTNSSIGANFQNALQVYSVQQYSGTLTTAYVTSEPPANGTVPIFSVPVSSGQYFDFDFSYYGADLDSVIVCDSTTGNTLTLGGANCGIQAIIRR